MRADASDVPPSATSAERLAQALADQLEALGARDVAVSATIVGCRVVSDVTMEGTSGSSQLSVRRL